MTTKRIKGVALALKIGTPPIEYMADITACTIEPEEAEDDVVTFKDVQDGETHDYLMKISAVQSTTKTSLWRHIWDHSGEEVAYTYAPHGNAVPTEDEPHFVGFVTIGPPPVIGGEAGKGNTYAFESEWKCTAKPTLVAGA